MKPLSASTKVGVVVVGYLLAAGVGLLAVWLRRYLTDPVDALASSGMHAWGDLMMFVEVFCIIGLVPTTLALLWLRAVPRFWRGLAFVAVAISLSGPAWLALASVVAPQSFWSVAAPLRVMAMPVGGGLWFVGGVFAPGKRERWILWGAALIEATGFAVTVLVKIVLPLAR
ncbi:MAG: hypothetical protein HZA32_13025 [Opitutae bacterium]|nr:hypothetical protein [Opitutae bacterium]